MAAQETSHGVSGADTWKLGGGLKERYVRLSALELRYYRSDKSDEAALGSLGLVTCEAVSLVEADICTSGSNDDASKTEEDECKGKIVGSVMFDIVTHSRVVTFHAADHNEARVGGSPC